tara:strand:- start:1105 stop:2070 length:966 start_codon:yes stop_codon:yes gene_type:complete
MNHLLNNISGWVHNGYAGNHLMANETDLGGMAGEAAQVAGAAATLQFNKAGVFPSLITLGFAPPGSAKVEFPEWAKVAVTSVTNAAVGADGDTVANTEFTSTSHTIPVERNSIVLSVSDMTVHTASGGNAMATFGEIAGNAVAAEFDNECCNLLDNLDNSVGSATTSLAFSTMMQGVALCEANDAMRPYAMVVHPQQYYGTFGITSEIGALATEQSVGALSGGSAVGDQIRSAGFASVLGGVSIYTSPQVVDGADSNDKKGGLFAKSALAAAVKDTGGGSFINVELERNAPASSTYVVANGYFSVAELVGEHGCVIQSEIA